jgi:16S rRNA (guanine966-N2)-methyltransferase
MRESLFSSIAVLVPGSVVLDLYAGTGSMGLEALSRGAVDVTFVEKDWGALKALTTNVETIGLGGHIIPSDVDRFLDSAVGTFDLAFVDPPYAVPLASLVETLMRMSSLMAAGGTTIVHRRIGSEAPEVIAALHLVDQRQYGGAELWRYEKEQT